MESVPHDTLSHRNYKAIMKKDKGFTTIDYKLPPRNAEPLRAVTEEGAEINDENDANLDGILGGSLPAEQKTIPKPTNVVSKKKKKGGLFSCMSMDAVEGVDVIATAPIVAPDTTKYEDDMSSHDKDDTESSVPIGDQVPDPEQESADPVVKKIVVEHELTS